MREIARKDFGYIFYELDDKFLLSTLCGTVGLFTVDFFLDENETSKYKEQGIDYIDYLAGDVTQFYDNYWDRCIITNLDYLVFGIFKSESYDSYSIYKIDKKQLEADNSESWHNDRFKKEGFIFKGNLLANILFKRHKHLIYSIPQEIYKCKLKTHNATDNKVENKIVLEYKCHESIYQFTIDLYDRTNEQNLTASMKKFVNRILYETDEIKNGC
jgi:hypothetical protein